MAHETIEEFRVRISAKLNAHFTKFRPVIDAINAGMKKTDNSKATPCPPP